MIRNVYSTIAVPGALTGSTQPEEDLTGHTVVLRAANCLNYTMRAGNGLHDGLHPDIVSVLSAIRTGRYIAHSIPATRLSSGGAVLTSHSI